MEGDKKRYKSIDDYISTFPPNIQEILITLRKVIQESAPFAEEKISYQMPTFAFHGNLVHFAAYKNHIGFYPGSRAIEIFKDKLSEYKSSKGAVQFPIEKNLPYDLISEIVTYRVAENLKKAGDKLGK